MADEEINQLPVKKEVYVKPEIIELPLELEGSFLNKSTGKHNPGDQVAVDDFDNPGEEYD